MPDVPPVPTWVAATVPKRGNRADENEDATATAADAMRFAIADGATEGWESRRWAARLVSAYIKRPPEPATFATWLAAARKWAPPAPPGAVPWYAEEKQEQGSFATLLGFELRRSRRTTEWAWRAVAVGDSCLLHVRGEKLELAVPLSAPEQFGSRPALVPSAAVRPCPEPEWFAGRAAPGDLFLLATDAAAARLLDPAERSAALSTVRAARDSKALVEWCKSVQNSTNDDVSILAITLPPAPQSG